MNAVLAALVVAFAVMVVAPSQAAASCGYMSTPRWHSLQQYGEVAVANVCSSTRRFKIDIQYGPDTTCQSIGPYASRRYYYTAWYQWRAYPRALLSC